MTNRPVGRYFLVMTVSMRESILEHASRIAALESEVPSLNALASAAGISKGGLMHHFPTRESLMMAIASQGIEAVDSAMSTASSKNSVLRTWLELSVPGKKDLLVFQSMAAIFFSSKANNGSINKLMNDANMRWELLLEKELGNHDAARVARLLGDGLLLGALSGTVTSENSSKFVNSAYRAIKTLVKDKN